MSSEIRKRVRRSEGSIVRIPIDDSGFGIGLVLREPLIAFYDHKYEFGDLFEVNEIIRMPIAFIIMVMNYAITDGIWPVIAKTKVPDILKYPPRFCKYDKLISKYYIYHEIPQLAPIYERPASREECRSLEVAAVWEPEHVEERLRDKFEGRENVWLQELRSAIP